MYGIRLNHLRRAFYNAAKQNEFEEAQKAGEALMSFYYEQDLSDLPIYSADVFRVAQACELAGELERANEFFLDAARAYERSTGKNADFADAITALAVNFSSLEKHGEAVTLFRQALEIRIKLFGEQSDKTADSCYNLANALYDTEDYENAINLHKRALELRDEASLEYADGGACIGYCYEKLGNSKLAFKNLELSLAVYKKICGMQSTEYLKNVVFLAQISDSLNDTQRAIKYNEACARLMPKLSPGRKLQYTSILTRLAELYEQNGDIEKALRWRLKAVKAMRGITGTEHLYYAKSLKNLACLYMLTDNFEMTERLLLHCLKIKKRLLGESCPDYLLDVMLLCEYYIKKEYYIPAVGLLRQTIEAINLEVEKSSILPPFFKDLLHIYFALLIFNNVNEEGSIEGGIDINGNISEMIKKFSERIRPMEL